MSQRRRLHPLGWFLLGAFAAGGIGSVATFSSVHTWYLTLHKPAWTPPNGLFGPVWTFLYFAMAVATWRVWRRSDGDQGAFTIRLYVAQLVLNALWSVFFFGLRNPGLGLVDIVALWILLVVMLLRYGRDRLGQTLWLLYVAWVSFAAALNYAIWRTN